MIAALLGTAIPLLDLSLWAYTSRLLYRRYRLHEAQKRACPKRETMNRHADNCRKCRNDVLWWEIGAPSRYTADAYTDRQLAGYAVLHGLFWPLALFGYGIYAFVTADPPLAPAEVEAARKAKSAADAAYVADLEKQLKGMAAQDGKP